MIHIIVAGKVRISPLFLAMLAGFIIVDGTAYILYILLAAAIHEMAHIIAIERVGGIVDSVELRMFGVKLNIRNSLALSYRQEIAIALVGPAVNLLTALLAMGVCLLTGGTQGALFFTAVNLMLFLINILPVENLDGGRALRALLLENLELDTAERICGIISVLFVIPMLIIGAVLFIRTGYNLSLAIISVYLAANIIVRGMRQ